MEELQTFIQRPLKHRYHSVLTNHLVLHKNLSCVASLYHTYANSPCSSVPN